MGITVQEWIDATIRYMREALAPTASLEDKRYALHLLESLRHLLDEQIAALSGGAPPLLTAPRPGMGSGDLRGLLVQAVVQQLVSAFAPGLGA